MTRRYTIKVGDNAYRIDVKELDTDRFRVVVDNRTFEVSLSAEEEVPEAVIRPEIIPSQEPPQERPLPIPYRPPAPETLRPLPTAGQLPLGEPPLPSLPHSGDDGPQRNLCAPMPGNILTLAVSVGDAVSKGQTLLVLEAMKMKNPIRSPQDGVIADILVRPGQIVGFGDVLLRFLGS